MRASHQSQRPSRVRRHSQGRRDAARRLVSDSEAITLDKSRGCAQDVPARGYGWQVHDLQHWRKQVPPSHLHSLSNRQGVHSPRDDARRIRQGGLEEAMKNSVLEIDPKRYGRLLARKLPAVIRTEEENERLIAELERACDLNPNLYVDSSTARPVSPWRGGGAVRPNGVLGRPHGLAWRPFGAWSGYPPDTTLGGREAPQSGLPNGCNAAIGYWGGGFHFCAGRIARAAVHDPQ